MQIKTPGAMVAMAFALLLAMLPLSAHGQENSTPAPTRGSFYSMQRPTQPPLPYNWLPGLPVVPLDSGIYLLDDRTVDYAAWEAENALLAALSGMEAGPQDGGQQQSSGAGADYCYNLLLRITQSSNVVILTITNALPNHVCLLWTNGDLNFSTWGLMTNVVPDNNGAAQVVTAIDFSTNFFFRASQFHDYTVDAAESRQGLGYYDSFDGAPDTMGAVSPTAVLEILNGSSAEFSSVALSLRQTNLMVQTSTSNLFALTYQGTNYPLVTMVDTRVLYDWRSRAWVASGMDRNRRDVILAVCTNEIPFFTNWAKYLLPISRPGVPCDYPTLGLDDNGIYIATVHIADGSGTNGGHTIVSVKKPEIYEGGLVMAVTSLSHDPPVWTIQPAVNFDTVSTNGYTWFVAKGPPQLGNPYRGGALFYRRMQWSGTNTLWVDTNWQTNLESAYLDYYDLDGTNVAVVAPPESGVSAPQAGGGVRIDLHLTGSRLMNAVVRHGFVWTCQQVGISNNGSYSGDATGTTVTRSAVQWLKLRITPDGSGLVLDSHGRMWDYTDSTNAQWYYFPSQAVNCAGDMLLGCSGSSATNYISAFYGWLPGNTHSNITARLLHAGTGYYGNWRWGDYSATVVDPSDDLTFWTVQEYAEEPLLPQFWATWIARLRLNP